MPIPRPGGLAPNAAADEPLLGRLVASRSGRRREIRRAPGLLASSSTCCPVCFPAIPKRMGPAPTPRRDPIATTPSHCLPALDGSRAAGSGCPHTDSCQRKEGATVWARLRRPDPVSCGTRGIAVPEMTASPLQAGGSWHDLVNAMATGLIAPIAVTAVIAMVLLMTNKRGPAVRREENPLHQASALAMGGRVIEPLRDGEVARFAGIRDGVEWTLRVVSTDDEETFRNTTLIRASESVRADRVLAVMGNDIDTSPSKWSWLDGSRREIAAMTSPDTIRFDGRKRLHVPGEQQTHVDQASASSSLPSPAYPRVTQG